MSRFLSALRPRGVCDLHKLQSQTPQLRTFPHCAIRQARHFTSEGEVLQGKHEDKSLEGRYATALFRVAAQQNMLEKVYNDLDILRTATMQSKDFKLFVESPVISADQKIDVMTHFGQKYKLEGITMNLLSVLAENRRLPYLKRMVDAFEVFYREAKGEMKCIVTSAQDLTPAQQKEIVAALQKRAGSKAKLIVEYCTSPAIMGGLMVAMGDQVLDFTVASRLERLQSELLAPLQ